MKFPAWLQVPLILVFGLLVSLPFQNFAWMDGGARATASVPVQRETSCRVTIHSCPKTPELAGVHFETHKDAHLIPLRCLARAQHFATACQAKEAVRAEFLRSGLVLNETHAITK